MANARTRGFKGPPGQKAFVKVKVVTKRLLKNARSKRKAGLTGYATLNVPQIIKLYYSDYWREKNIRIDLPNNYGHFNFLVYPVFVLDRSEKRASRRTRSSAQYDLLRIAKHRRLPACCRNSLKAIQVQMRLLATMAKAYKYKAWVEKVGDAKWVTETGKKLRDEALNEIKSRLKSPSSGEPTRESVLKRLTALTVSDAVAKVAFFEMMHHTKSQDADLRETWTGVFKGFKNWRDQLLKEKPEWEKNVKKAIVRQVLNSVKKREM